MHTSMTKRGVFETLRLLADVHDMVIQPKDLQFGMVVGAFQLTDCSYSAESSICGWGMANRWHWKIGGVWRLKEPFAQRGRQGWFKVTLERPMELESCRR